MKCSDRNGERLWCLAVGIGIGSGHWLFVGCSLAAIVLAIVVLKKHGVPPQRVPRGPEGSNGWNSGEP